MAMDREAYSIIILSYLELDGIIIWLGVAAMVGGDGVVVYGRWRMEEVFYHMVCSVCVVLVSGGYGGNCLEMAGEAAREA